MAVEVVTRDVGWQVGSLLLQGFRNYLSRNDRFRQGENSQAGSWMTMWTTPSAGPSGDGKRPDTRSVPSKAFSSVNCCLPITLASCLELLIDTLQETREYIFVKVEKTH